MSRINMGRTRAQVATTSNCYAAPTNWKSYARWPGRSGSTFYKITLPWSDEGFRLLPANFYFDLMARMREFEAGFEQGVESFLGVYPELLRYLNARRELPDAALRRVGNEQPIFEFYLLHGTLKQCRGHEHAKAVVEAASEQVDEILERMAEYQHFSSLLEHVGHELATRSATCLDGLSQDLLRHFDSSEGRQNYLLMQEVIADLPLRERAELGRQFDNVIQHMQAQAHGYAQATARVDARPDWIFVFGASKTWERASLLASMERVMRAALAHYQKRRCMMIIDRDGEGYEVAMSCPGLEFTPAEADALNGARLFGGLHVAPVPLEGF